MEAPHEIKRRDWLHSEARCPNCGLHLDPNRDLEEAVRKNSDTRAVGAFVTHRRCGAKFSIALVEP